MKRIAVVGLAFAVVVSGCRDLTIKEAPPLGSLRGSVDTQGHTTPGSIPVVVIDSRGARTTLTTLADGSFVSPQITPGVYAVQVSAPGFAPLTIPFVQVSGGAETDLGVLQPGWLAGTPQASSISGVVSNSQSADVSGATVTFRLMPNRDLVATQTVGHDGLFVVSVPPGTYELGATHPDFNPANPITVTVAEGERKEADMPLLLQINPGRVTGSVRREVDGNTSIPATGVNVLFEGGQQTTTDGMGEFSFDLPAGTYRVRYAFPAPNDVAFIDPEPSRTIVVKGGQNLAIPQATLVLARGSIKGKVELADRTPIDQISVSVTGTGYGSQVTPDATQPWVGSFTINGVPFGVVEVSAARQRYSRASATATVGPMPVDVGTLRLALQTGDFIIDDNDPTSETGYTRTLGVTLNFTGFPRMNVTGFRVSESQADLADAGFAGYTGPLQQFMLSDADSQHTVYAQYQDNANNVSPVFQQTIVVDRVAPTAPTVSFLFTGEVGQGSSRTKFTNLNQNVPLTVTGSDQGSGLSKMRITTMLATDGGVPDSTSRDSYATSTSIAGPFNDGRVNAWVQLVDLAGNISAPSTDSIVVDKTAPMGSFAIANGVDATGPGLTNQLDVVVTPSVSPEPFGGVVQIKYANATGPELDGAPYVVAIPTQWSLAFGPDGLRTVSAVLRDSAGNTTQLSPQTITLDTTPLSPTQVSASVASPSPTNDAGVMVALSAVSGADISTTKGVTLSEDSTFTSPGTVGPVGIPVSGQLAFQVTPGEGARPFFVGFRDAAGNRTIVPLSVTLDTTAPTGTISLLGALADGTLSTTLSASSTVTVQANITGATRYFVGGASLTACPTNPSSYLPLSATGTFTYAGAASGGNIVVRTCFRDDAGNVFGGPVSAMESPLLWAPSASIAYSGTAPACSFAVTGVMADGVTAAPALLTARPTVSYAITNCTGATPTEMVIVNGPINCASLPGSTSWQPFLASGTINVPAGDGAKQISACVRDIARNPAPLTPVTLTLDTTPPPSSTLNGVSASVLTAQPTNQLALTVGVSVASSVTDLATTPLSLSEDYGFSSSGTLGPVAIPGNGQVPFTITSGDGVRAFFARFTDRVGNATIVNLSATVDTTPPSGTVSLLGTLADLTPSSSVTTTQVVTVLPSVTGATRYYLGDASLTSCPSANSSYTDLPPTGAITATLPQSAGVITVRACFRDAAGNTFGGPVTAGVSPLLWLPAATIAYDNAAPTGCVLSMAGKMVDGSPAPANLTARTDVTWAMTGCTGAAEMVIANGALTCAGLPGSTVWQPFTAAGAITLPVGDSGKTVSACVRDTARNVVGVVAPTITLDTTPPPVVGPNLVTATLSSPSTTNSLTVTAAVSSTVADLSPTRALTVSEDSVFLAGGTVGPMAMPMSGTVNLTLLAGDGVRTFYARFLDQVGNPTVIPINVTVDTQPPTGSISLQGQLADGSSSSTVSASTSITVLSTVQGATGYYLGDATLSACPTTGGSYTAIPASGQISTTGTAAAGAVTVRACFRDAAGNIFGGPVTAGVSPLLWAPAATIPYDNAGPTGCAFALSGRMADTGLAAPAGFTGTTTIDYSLTSCVGAAQMAVATGVFPCASLPANVSWQDYVSGGTLSVALPDGTKNVTACVRDAARNLTALTPMPATITLDTTPPAANQVSVGLTSPGPTNNLTISITLSSTATDLSATPVTISTDYAFVSGTILGPIALSTPVLYTLSAGEGLRTFFVRFKDRVGNGIIVPGNVPVDQTPPSGTIDIEGVLGDGSSSYNWASQLGVTLHAENIAGAAGYFIGSASLTTCPTAQGAYTNLPPNKLISVSLVDDGTGYLTARACFRDAAGNVFGGPAGTGWDPSDVIQFNNSSPQACAVTLRGKKVDGTLAPNGRTARTDIGFAMSGCVGATEMAIFTTPTLCSAAQASDWAPYQKSGTVNLPTGDGVYTVQICARNAALNVATVPGANITLDTTPPSNAWTVIEQNDGWVNRAEQIARVGNFTRIDAAYSNATELIVRPGPGMTMSPQSFPITGSNATVYFLLAASPNPGQQTFYTYFSDDVGNLTPSVLNTVGLDTTAPAAPVLSTASPGNRSMTLFWSPVLGDPTIAGYGLLSAATPAALPSPPSAVTVSGNVGQGTVPNLFNRTEYQFAVYTFDAAGNLSAPSNALTAVTGFNTLRVPIVSTYTIKPLDVAVRGDEIFLTYSEQGISWGATTGNVKVAHSPDFGESWDFATIDPEFGFNRTVARLTVTEDTTFVSTVGTNLLNSDAGVGNVNLGAVKVYSNSNSATWTSQFDNTTTPVDFTDTSGVGLSVNGLPGVAARLYYFRQPEGINDLYSRSIGSYYLCGGFFFPPCPSPSYFNFTDTVQVKDLKTCVANNAQLHAWRGTSGANTTVSLVWQRFISMSALTTGASGDGDISTIAFAAPAIENIDLACSALPSRTNGYAVFSQGANLRLYRRLGSAVGWSLSTLQSDVDPTSPPKIYASGTSVHVVYRNTTGELRLGTSTTEGTGFVWTRLTTDPTLGFTPIINGDGHADLVIASGTSDQSSINLHLPVLRNVKAVATAGVGTASLDWDRAGASKFRVDRNTTGNDPWPSTLFSAQPRFNVSAGTVQYHRLSAVDALDQGTDEGQIWQVAPFNKKALYTPSGGCSPTTPTAGIVAYDAKVLVTGPLGCKALGDFDLTLYRSSDSGANFAAYTPDGIVTTHKALDGTNGRAILAYRSTTAPGLYVRMFADITGAASAAQSIDVGTFVNSVSVLMDRTAGSNFGVVAASNTNDTITIATCVVGTGCTVRPAITIPNAGSSTLYSAQVWRVEGARISLVWRQYNGGNQIWFAESINSGASFAAPVMLADGSTSLPPNATGTYMAASSNGAYSVAAYQGTLNSGDLSNSLFITVTGNDLPTNAYYAVQRYTLDSEPMQTDVMGSVSSLFGTYILYQTYSVQNSSERHLKLVTCRTDCHKQYNWTRSLLQNVPAQGGLSLAVSTLSSGGEERLFATYWDGTAIQLLYGGALRRTR